jgi:hypothetical protein
VSGGLPLTGLLRVFGRAIGRPLGALYLLLGRLVGRWS